MYVGCKQGILFVLMNSQCNMLDVIHHYILKWGLFPISSDHIPLVDYFLLHKVTVIYEFFSYVCLIVNAFRSLLTHDLQDFNKLSTNISAIRVPQNSYWCPKYINNKNIYVFEILLLFTPWPQGNTFNIASYTKRKLYWV